MKWNNNNNNNNQLYQKQFTFFIVKFSKSTSSAILVLFQFQSSRDKMCKLGQVMWLCLWIIRKIIFFFVIDVLKLTKPTRKTISTTPMIEEIKRKKGIGKKCAPAGSRTRVNGLGSRHDNRYTTSAHALCSGEILLLKLLMPLGKSFFLLYRFLSKCRRRR